MGLFDFLRGSPAQTTDSAAAAAAEARREASERSLENGGLPANAEVRLRHQRAAQTLDSHLWTSDLSVAELTLTQAVGYEPLGQVMGASIYQVGFQWRTQNWRNSAWMSGASYELDAVSRAFTDARQLAVSRLRQEASLLGADGVVGVRLQRRSSDWTMGSAEFQAIGTAIRLRDTPARDESYKPFLCALSGEEFWKLKCAGIAPLGLVAGNCTYYCIPGWSTQNATTGGIFSAGAWSNQELPEYTQSLYTAREIALERLSIESRALGAEGTVGMTINYNAEPHEVEINKRTRIDMLYHFLALGTAVRTKRNVATTVPARVLSLGYRPVSTGFSSSLDT